MPAGDVRRRHDDEYEYVIINLPADVFIAAPPPLLPSLSPSRERARAQGLLLHQRADDWTIAPLFWFVAKQRGPDWGLLSWNVGFCAALRLLLIFSVMEFLAPKIENFQSAKQITHLKK